MSEVYQPPAQPESSPLDIELLDGESIELLNEEQLNILIQEHYPDLDLDMQDAVQSSLDDLSVIATAGFGGEGAHKSAIEQIESRIENEQEKRYASERVPRGVGFYALMNEANSHEVDSHNVTIANELRTPLSTDRMAELNQYQQA